MTNSKARRVVAIVGTTAVFGAAAAGCGSASTSTPSATAAGGAAQQQAAPTGRPGPPSAADLSALAAKLGVSTAKLQQAMQAAGSGAPTDRIATLAKQLGLSTAKVQAALHAVRPPRGAGPPQGTPPGAASQTTSS